VVVGRTDILTGPGIATMAGLMLPVVSAAAGEGPRAVMRHAGTAGRSDIRPGHLL